VSVGILRMRLQRGARAISDFEAVDLGRKLCRHLTLLGTM